MSYLEHSLSQKDVYQTYCEGLHQCWEYKCGSVKVKLPAKSGTVCIGILHFADGVTYTESLMLCPSHIHGTAISH